MRALDLARVASKGVFAAADILTPTPPGPRLLIYHQLTPHPTRQMELEPDLFRRQMEWLITRGKVVHLDNAITSRADRGSENNFVLTFDDGHRGLAEYGVSLLEDLGLPFTLYISTGLIDSEPGYLTWEQLDRIAATGLMTVAAHTHTHPDLRSLDRSDIERELDLSNEIIESRLGVKPKHFAYPKGFWSETAESLLRERYETSALGAGPPIVAETDLHRLSRIPVQKSDGFLLFKRKVAGGMRAEEWMRRRLKNYSNPG